MSCRYTVLRAVRTLRSVTSNTRAEGRAMLSFAAEHRLTLGVAPYPMAQAGAALVDLAADRVNGAAVLIA